MKFRILFSTAVLAMLSTNVFAQHSDIEFGYGTDPTEIEIEGVEFTTDGFALFEAEMEELDPDGDPGNFSSDEPGYTTNDAEGLLVNEDDRIWLRAVDASVESLFGVGYVNYYNPTEDMLEASGRLSILDNTASTADLILNGGSIESGDNPQFLAFGDEHGDVHAHVDVDLLDDATAPTGAYGILFQMQSDFDVADGNMDAESDFYWIVWNHGMDEEDFENLALPKFGLAAVPEPGSLSLLALGATALFMRRRRS